MSTTTLIIFVAVLVVTVIVNDLTLTITMKKKIEELKIERANLNFSLIQNFRMYFDGIRKKEQQDTEFIAEITKQNDILKEQYEALDEAYDHMNERYMEICEHYSKLLTCWAGVEERYSDCYEQLKYQNERFDRIERYFEDQRRNMWYPGTYPIGAFDAYSFVGENPICKYNHAGECQNENCPALNMYCTSIDPASCRYSNLARDPIGEEE